MPAPALAAAAAQPWRSRPRPAALGSNWLTRGAGGRCSAAAAIAADAGGAGQHLVDARRRRNCSAAAAIAAVAGAVGQHLVDARRRRPLMGGLPDDFGPRVTQTPAPGIGNDKDRQ